MPGLPPRRPRPLLVRKNQVTGNWIWRCGSKKEKNCFNRWGFQDSHFRAFVGAMMHYHIWHVKGNR